MSSRIPLIDDMISDPVVRAALRDVHGFVNANNQLAQPEDKDYTRAALKLLHRGRHRLDPDELAEWALANDWGAVAAKRLREFTERVLEGRNFVYKSGSVAASRTVPLRHGVTTLIGPAATTRATLSPTSRRAAFHAAPAR